MLQSAPLITRENANKMREKGYESKLAKRNAEITELKKRLEAALTPPPEDEQRRKERLLQQVTKCDVLLAECENVKEFAQLVSAKARLWELLYPKPGSLRPKTPRASIANLEPIPEPIPALVVSPSPVSTDKPQSEVVSNSSENHKDATS